MSCPQFVADSFALRTSIHLAHLSSQSYAEHVALGEFYSALEDFADTYAEIYMGLEGRVKRWPGAPRPNEEPKTMLRDYLEVVRAEMAEDLKSEALKNVLAEIEGLTARTLYKLENLA
jgi:hypothetical protein